MVIKVKSNVREEAKTGNTGITSSEEACEGAGLCGRIEEEKEVQIGSVVVYKDGEHLRAAIITAHQKGGTVADLVFFQGQGSGHASGASNVKRGMNPGQWWWNEKDLKIAKKVLG